MHNKEGVFKENASSSFIPEQNLRTYYLYDQQTIEVCAKLQTIVANKLTYIVNNTLHSIISRSWSMCSFNLCDPRYWKKRDGVGRGVGEGLWDCGEGSKDKEAEGVMKGEGRGGTKLVQFGPAPQWRNGCLKQ